jgi:tetratricopeptide (TPR) repeat protein
MKRICSVLAPAVLLLVISVSAFAQRVTVRGHVVGPDGNPLPGAEILLVNRENGQKFTMTTDKKGEYINIGVFLGNYHLTLSKDGKTLFAKDVTVSGEQEEKVIDIDVPKAQQQKQEAQKQLTPEQRKQIEEQQKAVQAEQAKIQNLNQMLAQADAAEKAGNLDQAISVYKQATAMDASQPILWYRLGEAYSGAAKKAGSDRAAASEDYTEAVEAYKKAIALKPSEPGFHNNLGAAYARLGKTDDAASEYTAAAQLDPAKAAMYYYNLGATLTNAGKVDEANAAFDKVLAIDPNRADAYYWKGVNLLGKATLGKDNKMIAPAGTAENLNKYLALAPDGPHAADAKELLTSIGAKVETSYQKKK